MRKKKTVLILGDYQQTIAAIRSLARAGFAVVLGCETGGSSTARSRYVSAVLHLDGAHPRRYCYQLEAFLRKQAPDFVFPIGEAEMRRVLYHDFGRLAALSTWAMPEPATVESCFDKVSMYALAGELGVPAAPWRPYVDEDRLLLDAAEMGYPVLLKRRDSSNTVRKKKALICRDAEALGEFAMDARYDPDPGSLLIQKVAPGLRHNCHIAAVRGCMVAYFEQKVLRTDEPDGTGCGLEGVSVAPSDNLRRYCAQLIEGVRYHGIGCIQFLVDEVSGAVSFLEFNARMDGTALLPYRLGMDFPLMAMRIAAGAPADPPADYPVGKRYYTLYRDLNVWLSRRRDQSLGQAILWTLAVPPRVLRSYDIMFEWRDPAPTLHQFGKKAFTSAYRGVQRMLGRRSLEPSTPL